MTVDLVEDNQLPRQVSCAAGEEFAKQMNAQFFETSSKNNTNVTEVFNYIGTCVQSRRQLQPSSPSRTVTTTPSSTVELDASPQSKSGGMGVIL